MEYQSNDLINFLICAKKNTYAGHGPEKKFSCRPDSHDFHYKKGDYLYIDTYLGGYNFAGEEAVWYKNSPIWSMNYMGRVIEESFDGDFLREAMMLVSKDMPFRGPSEYKQGDYRYLCEPEGDLNWFQGKEQIFYKEILVYELYFHGGEIS